MKSLIGILLAFAVSTSAAEAVSVKCGPHDAIVAKLKGKHKEKQAAIGITSRGGLLEIFQSPTGNFTILITSTGGISCIVESGHSLEVVTIPAGEPA